MGCSAKESLEDQMLLMKLDRLEIQMEKEIRIITLGPSGVGKTSIIERIINKKR